MGYNHSSVNKQENAASVTGGYFYRSTTDPCMYGRWVRSIQLDLTMDETVFVYFMWKEDAETFYKLSFDGFFYLQLFLTKI